MNGKIDQKIKGTLSPCGSMCTKCWEIKVLLTNQYIRFVEVASGIIRNSRIPLYSSKFLIKTYSQHQLLILILLKEYLSEAYRDIVNLSGLLDEIIQRINLDSIPHFTTLHKFSQRIDSSIFTRLLNLLIKLLSNEERESHVPLSIHLELLLAM